MRCDELMKKEPTCVKENEPVQSAAQRMREQNIGFLPICDGNGKPIGTVTDRDLTIRVLAQGKNGTTRIAEVMSRDVVACQESEDIGKASQLMAQNRKSRIMVTDNAGKLVGVISLSDIAHQDSGHAARTIREVTNREVRV
jgi:CBS domain-containing protein